MSEQFDRIEAIRAAMRDACVHPEEASDGSLILRGKNVDRWWKIIGPNANAMLAHVTGQPIDDPHSPKPIPLGELETEYPNRAEPVVDGLLRRGETMNVIAAPKVGKTWLAHGLARAVATGDEWLGFETRAGRVLILDAELHPTELRNRLRAVCGPNAMSSLPIDVVPLRGRGTDIGGVAEVIGNIEPNHYDLLVVDALYRFIPSGVSENDNSQMMGIYNRLDAIASASGAAIAVVHHSSKGDQSQKSVTDFGSGAGSISRATDTHIAIRPHRCEDCAVLEAVCRSFKQPDPITIKWEYPQWMLLENVEPELASRATAADERQKRNDADADREIRTALSGKKLSVSQLRSATGMGPDRINRALRRLNATGKKCEDRSTGKRSERFRLPESTEVERSG